MYKFLLIGCVLIIALCLSCGDQSLDEISVSMGEEYLTGSSSIELLDTLSVTTSTMTLDSVVTSASGSLLVGSYYNEDFGLIHADAIFRIQTPGEVDIDIDDDIFDSIVLCLKYNEFYLGDTTQLHSFTVEQVGSDLIEMLKDNENSSGTEYFYNTTTVTSSRELADYTYTPETKENDTLKIRLDDELGEEWLRLLDEKSDSIEEDDDFLDYFRGIVLRSKRDAANYPAIIGFAADETMCIYLHYHTVMDAKVSEKIKFTVTADETYQFNSIEEDRSMTTLSSLTTQKEDISSSLTDDKSFIQGSTGVMTKVEFPGLERLEILPVLDQIIKAEIILYVTEDIENDINDLPTKLSVYETNSSNVIGSQITDSSGDIIYMELGNESDEIDDPEYYYSVDITDQLIDELLDGSYDDDFSFAIRLLSSIETSTATSISFEGQNVTEYKPELRLYTYYY